ncbi:MAG: dihydrolipoamide acetyltransferase family protein [Novosphingobium sp.]|jgi:2-oxoisovalerate dehydrogenase E2 component (dihydrolipoyl transacylase)|nr:dihydrolipoamide acetyltransferase family protein [Novosphingobium sp.]
MALFQFRLPDIGEGVAEAEIVAWHVKPGDTIKEDQSLVDVMTDKATVDMTSPVDGVVLTISGEVGRMVAVGSVLVELEIEGEGNTESREETSGSQFSSSAGSPTSPPQKEPTQTSNIDTSAPRTGVSSRHPVTPASASRAEGNVPHASPATRRRAYELGIPLQFVSGSGPGGRITAEDLDAYILTGAAVGDTAGRSLKKNGFTEAPIIGMRRKIAERMQAAKRSIPHITYVEECDLTQLESLRLELNSGRRDDQPKLTLLPFFMRALAKALRDFPKINSHYDDEVGILRSYDGIHIGIATQTANGLMVPVIRHVEGLDLWDCARELSRISQSAREGKATRDELTGSTITLTSLGSIAGVVSTPVINQPEVAILAPNKLVEKPVIQNGFVSMRKMMNLSSSFDHRIVDGWDAASFIQQMKRLLEHPALIFMD